MKKFLVILLLAVLGYYIADTYFDIGFGQPHFVKSAAPVKDIYLAKTQNPLKVSNAVTSIVVNFRGFDTLGEVTVLFLAVTVLGSVLYKKRHHVGERSVLFNSSSIVTSGSKLLFPAIILLGAYVFIHGHLSPGGGFQGGVIIATGFLLMLLAYENYSVSHTALSIVESLAGITFAGVGLLGFMHGGTFLQNFLPSGVMNNLFSGGVIPIIYIAVGFKVGAELTGVIYTVLHEKGENNG
ncbi:Na(+)/H(+) antiporter subunit B [Candidatus Sulfidibacterium hydrothermale]|uniref:Na(+)/H(+) antiporter subunit B n=1 Tax=Candidatus Sulfidibacterium hydrothermale TaxID=2875962 RepID=UPI001F0A3A5C|nr:Na(+)/H(+) antiporter subunit B [Candidatus Sulfidibacterium hydrothermale]UBM62719.1 Na(+)/H(+) antiporter subunit B [Candidatus Sulfidibacterium hydrothermale]